MSQKVTLTVFGELDAEEIVLEGEGDTFHLRDDHKGITLESIEVSD